VLIVCKRASDLALMHDQDHGFSRFGLPYR
jgi:hypothetical protein